MTETAKPSRPADRWIPWMFVLFFGIVAALDATFVTIALKTNTGTITDNAYEKGVAYNKTLEAAAKQNALGWQADIGLDADRDVTVTLRDSGGLPLEGASVLAKLVRPVQDGYDFELPLTDRGGGLYAAPAAFPLPGQWSVRIFASWQGKQYQHSRTIVIR